MSTTNGATVGPHTAPFGVGPVGRARGWLLSAVQAFAMPGLGARPRSALTAAPAADPVVTALSAAGGLSRGTIAGPLGVDGHRASVHPGGRKLAAVAHYRAMADEVARERRLSTAGLGAPATTAVGRHG
jgi:hypothetical protein